MLRVPPPPPALTCSLLTLSLPISPSRRPAKDIPFNTEYRNYGGALYTEHSITVVNGSTFYNNSIGHAVHVRCRLRTVQVHACLLLLFPVLAGCLRCMCMCTAGLLQ